MTGEKPTVAKMLDFLGMQAHVYSSNMIKEGGNAMRPYELMFETINPGDPNNHFFLTCHGKEIFDKTSLEDRALGRHLFGYRDYVIMNGNEYGVPDWSKMQTTEEAYRSAITGQLDGQAIA
ncbi:hypothetical protein, partial [Treponema sp. R6D11]